MKTLKNTSLVLALCLFISSCHVTSINQEESAISLNQLLNSYDIWYVDINATKGYGEIPFLQRAFTISFFNGEIFANNNLVGIGSQGNGYGIYIGQYNTYDMSLETHHNIDGSTYFEVYQKNNNTIELYHPNTQTSYFLKGFHQKTFDYNYVFYDNIQYFLQEYQAWEKSFTSNQGTPNAFDDETYLQFIANNIDLVFQSSKDNYGLKPNSIFWDFTGIYQINTLKNNTNLKRLILDYDHSERAVFELSVINDSTIELYHINSNTIYQFIGINYISYLKNNSAKPSFKTKKRIQQTIKTPNSRK